MSSPDAPKWGPVTIVDTNASAAIPGNVDPSTISGHPSNPYTNFDPSKAFPGMPAKGGATEGVTTAGAEVSKAVGEAGDVGATMLRAADMEAPVPAADAKENPYAKLLDPSYEPPQVTSTYNPAGLPLAQTSMRSGYWKPATPDQIANAKGFGIDLAASNAKYYPYQSANKK